ncbi:MAG: 5-dehydro-2-deoxygluconokinase [Dongiaceae bacterium]
MVEAALDLICLGRAAVDLYAEQPGARLEDVSSFAKYLGGCAANIAVGVARQGLSVGILTRVGDEHMGRFVRETLQAEGVNVTHVGTDPNRLTGLVLLGIKDRQTFPLIFYRENCADMALDADDIDPQFVASAKALLVTGTHLSTDGTMTASRRAIDLARQAGRKVILDIDYRPVLWGLTGRGAGEIRYIPAEGVSQHLQKIVPLCDLVVGTEEEICIAGGDDDVMAALRQLRGLTAATFVVKRGPLGCSVFPGAIGDTLDSGVTVEGVTVDVLNVLGAGDGFLAGFLRGWLRGEPLEDCCRYANACGALVVSRHGCAPAIPTRAELDDYLLRAHSIARPDQDTALNHLHRVTTRKGNWPEIMALAFDHRSQLEQVAVECGRKADRIPYLKMLIGRALLQVAADYPGRIGLLADDQFGRDVLEHLTGRGLWIGRPVERPGSRPLRFAAGENIALALRQWPAEHIAKCLVFHHPEDRQDLRIAQLERLSTLQEAAIGTGHEFLIEIIPPKDMPARRDTVEKAMAQIYDAGIRPDWWKLPGLEDAAWRNVTTLVEREDTHCRGVVLLGLEASEDVLAQSFAVAARHPICKGFAIGRSIFMQPARDWMTRHLKDDEFVETVEQAYRRLIDIWRQARPL